jgi:hypothetical protein
MTPERQKKTEREVLAIPMERRGKNVSTETNKQATLEEFLEDMFNLYIV